jgi:hypothetical protein
MKLCSSLRLDLFKECINSSTQVGLLPGDPVLSIVKYRCVLRQMVR